MSTTTAMLIHHPIDIGLDTELLAEGIDALLECAQTCTACADACLAEGTVAELRRCIRANQDCADICVATARVLSRRTGSVVAILASLLQACSQACRTCGEECAAHAGRHEHCAICAAACRRAEGAANDLLGAVTQLMAAPPAQRTASR